MNTGRVGGTDGVEGSREGAHPALLGDRQGASPRARSSGRPTPTSATRSPRACRASSRRRRRLLQPARALRAAGPRGRVRRAGRSGCKAERREFLQRLRQPHVQRLSTPSGSPPPRDSTRVGASRTADPCSTSRSAASTASSTRPRCSYIRARASSGLPSAMASMIRPWSWIGRLRASRDSVDRAERPLQLVADRVQQVQDQVVLRRLGDREVEGEVGLDVLVLVGQPLAHELGRGAHPGEVPNSSQRSVASATASPSRMRSHLEELRGGAALLDGQEQREGVVQRVAKVGDDENVPLPPAIGPPLEHPQPHRVRKSGRHHSAA